MPKSREMTSAVGLLLGLLTLKFFGPFIVGNLQNIGKLTLTHLNGIQLDPVTLHAHFIRLMMQIGVTVFPIFAVMMVAGGLVNYLQIGPLFSFEPLTPKFEKLSPLRGLKQIFSKNGLVETVKAFLKIIFIGFIAVVTIRQDLPYFQTLGSKAVPEIFGTAASLCYKIGIRVAMASLLLGILDIFYQRWSYAEKLKMTKQEVKEERRESEIAPEVKRLLQERQLSATQRRMMKEVPDADVVITNPTHITVALKYDRAVSEGPMVVAKGADYIAKKIVEIIKLEIRGLRRKEALRLFVPGDVGDGVRLEVGFTLRRGENLPDEAILALAKGKKRIQESLEDFGGRSFREELPLGTLD